MMPGAATPASFACRSSSAADGAQIGLNVRQAHLRDGYSHGSFASHEPTLIGRREVFESRVLLQEDEPHRAGGPVALLADDQFGDALGLGRHLTLDRIHLFAIDEHDDVGVLFQRARLTKVGQLRTVIAAAFGGPAQLAERNDGDFEFLGENLQRSRDRRKLLLPVVELPAALHQLQVVDDQHVQAVLHLEPPGLGAHLENAD